MSDGMICVFTLIYCYHSAEARTFLSRHCCTSAVTAMGILSHANLEAIYTSLPSNAPVFAISITRLALITILPVDKNGDCVHPELAPVIGPATLRLLYRQGPENFEGLITQIRAFKVGEDDIPPAFRVDQRWGHTGPNLSWLTVSIPGTSINCCLWVP